MAHSHMTINTFVLKGMDFHRLSERKPHLTDKLKELHSSFVTADRQKLSKSGSDSGTNMKVVIFDLTRKFNTNINLLCCIGLENSRSGVSDRAEYYYC